MTTLAMPLSALCVGWCERERLSIPGGHIDIIDTRARPLMLIAWHEDVVRERTVAWLSAQRYAIHLVKPPDTLLAHPVDAEP